MSATTRDEPHGNLDALRKWMRDGTIIAGIIVLVIFPGIIGRFVHLAQVDLVIDEKEKTLTIKAHQDAVALASNVSDLATQAQALKDEVAQGRGADPGGLAARIASLADQANTLSTKTQNLLATQQQAAGVLDAGAVPSDGWMYLGKVDGPKPTAWSGTPNIAASAPVDLAGHEYAAAGNVFIRANQPVPANPQPGFRARQKVRGVVRGGQTVLIDQVEVDPALGGGFALWATVRQTGG
jgi:hypothetical protein